MSDTIPIKVKGKNENYEEIDLSFLPEDEKIIWQSTSWVNYLEIYKNSLRKFMITNVVAVLICIALSIIFILYVAEVVPYLIWFILIIYGTVLGVAEATAIISFSISPFAFIPISKYKKNYPEKDLDPYCSFKLLTTKNFIFKAVKNSKTKWSDFQKECFKLEDDRITCSIGNIKQIILQPDHVGFYMLTTFGEFTGTPEKSLSKQHRLLKWNLSPKQVAEILPHLLNMEKERKLSLKIYGTSKKSLYVFFLIFIIIYAIGLLL